MKTYWDLDPSERSEISEQRVREYITVELMEQGVLHPVEPVFDEVDEPELPVKTYYRIVYNGKYGDTLHDVAFASSEQAEQFVSLTPFMIVDDYETGSTFTCQMVAARVQSFEVTEQCAVEAARAALEDNKKKKSRNEELQRVHSAALDTVSRASGGIWSDWHRCLEEKAELERVRATFDEYVVLCDGNESTARAFLAKVFEDEQIDSALEPERVRPPKPVRPTA